MSYYNNEEEFLSVYMSTKLIKGGKPEVSKEELDSIRDKFLHSFYSSYLIEPLTKLKFSNLQDINEKFQLKASKNRSWLKPCFEYRDDKLYPTYAFFDFTQTTSGEFFSFLHDDRYKNTIALDYINTDEAIADVDKKYIPNAKKVANYLTKYFAKKYIDMEIKNGRWPVHMKNVSTILNMDLGTILKLPGTKQFFKQFHHHVQTSIAILLTHGNGNLILSNKKYGDLEYNNLKRILNISPIFERMCSSSYTKGQNKFDIIIQDNIIKCKETTLVDEDPYGNFSDVYSIEEKSL